MESSEPTAGATAPNASEPTAAATAAAALNARYELDCPICMQPFLEPVVTSCAHAFCRHCIQRAMCPPDLYPDDYVYECPICRGMVGILEPSERLASLVRARFGDDYAKGRRAEADVPAEPVAAAPAAERDAPREAILEAVRRQGGYRTLELNTVLDLSSSGWERLPACLPELRGLRQLRCEHNLLRSLDHLALPALIALSAHHNQIQSIGGALLGAPRLVRLDLSHNLLSRVDGLSGLACLQSLNLAGNRLGSRAAVEHLAECAPSLDVLDLSRNQLPAEALQPLGGLAGCVRVLYLTLNPLVAQASEASGSYRKGLIAAFPRLAYLDDKPVDPPERGAAEAWARGGDEAERDEKLRQQAERSARLRSNTAYMMEKKRAAMQRRREQEQAAAEGGGPPARGDGAAGASADGRAPPGAPDERLSLRAVAAALPRSAASAGEFAPS